MTRELKAMFADSHRLVHCWTFSIGIVSRLEAGAAGAHACAAWPVANSRLTSSRG
jgi:hypothetical protein